MRIMLAPKNYVEPTMDNHEENVVMDLLLPSIADCRITLYNSILFNRGVGIIGCWFPWRGNSLGVSLSVI